MTVFALLLSLLLGYAPAAASAGAADRSAARPAKSEFAKASTVLRTGGRLQSDDRDREDLLAAAPARPVVIALWQQPEATAAKGEHLAFPAPLARAYRARAPPAA